MTDCELILSYLKDGKWHNGISMSLALKPNSVSWAYRSRISELRKKGYKIESRIGENGCAEYRLITAPDEPVFTVDESGQSSFL